MSHDDYASERIQELIRERDEAREKLISLQKEIFWKCCVCDFPMLQVAMSRWECKHCEQVSRLQAEINKLKGVQ